MRDNRARRKAGRVIVDGWKETGLAIEAGLKLCGLFLPESVPAGTGGSEPLPTHAPELRTVLKLPEVAAKTARVSVAVMEKISYGQSNRGVVAEFERPTWSLDQLDLPESPIILVLDRIEKPGNVGAVFRCADAAGIDAVLLCDSCDLFNPNAIRSSLGTVFHVRAASGTESQVKQFLINHGIRVLAARVESSCSVWSARLAGPLAIVLGNEAEGLADRWRELNNCPVEGIRVPMAGRIDSLNVSVTAALIAFEAKRRRETAGID